METLRVVQVTHSFPPYFGGLSHVTEMIAKNLAKEGHEVEVITLDIDGNLPPHEDLEGVSVRRFRGYAPSGAYFVPSRQGFRYLQSVRGDVIHAHNIGSLLTPACWMALGDRLSSTPFVVTPHHHTEGSQWHTRLLWKPYWPLARRVVRAADTVHCVSRFESAVVSRDFSVTSVIIPNGVSEDVFRHSWSQPRNIVLTYAGRLEAYKRIDRLIQAAHLLGDSLGSVSVRVIGNGPDLPRLEALSRSLGVRVEHYPFLEREDYLEMLATSSCLVNLSKYEAFSIVVAEALAIGVPVVAALPWGETFSEFRGVRLVDSDSLGEVAQGINDLITSSQWGFAQIPSWRDVVHRLLVDVYGPAIMKKST